MNSDFRVGPWTVRPSLNIASQNGTTERLEPKVMEVLVCLASRSGETVPKEEILKSVWADTFVSDDVLVRSISEIRRVFGDDPRKPRFIQTIPKRGYRLVAKVGSLEGSYSKEVAIIPIEPLRPRRKYLAFATIGVMLLSWVLVGFNFARVKALWETAPQIRSLAVLPLQNLSSDPAQEYFSDGMTEELITELSRISGMRVISRTSVMRYKNSSKSLPVIARELGVDGIVEGSVLRSGDKVRITAQLIDGRNDANLWADTYDRGATDVFAVQEAVANAIAIKVRATMSPKTNGAPPQHTVSLKAHEYYLRGDLESGLGGTLSNQEGKQEEADEHLRRGAEYYKKAIQEDPAYARAYLALASACPDAGISGSEAYARKALELDESLGDAHVLIGAIELVRDRNWADAERELLRAIELEPSNVNAHVNYAYFLDTAGRMDEGMKEWDRAQELDPGSDHLAGALYSRRQYDRLIELEKDELARNTDNAAIVSIIAHKTLMVAYARLSRYKESIEEFREALLAYGYTSLAEDIRRGYAHGGYEGALREWLKGIAKEKREFPFPFVAAYVHAELGERDAAIAFLSKMKVDDVGPLIPASVFPTPVSLRNDPMWDTLHSDPRFQALVRNMNFPN